MPDVPCALKWVGSGSELPFRANLKYHVHSLIIVIEEKFVILKSEFKSKLAYLRTHLKTVVFAYGFYGTFNCYGLLREASRFVIVNASAWGKHRIPDN